MIPFANPTIGHFPTNTNCGPWNTIPFGWNTGGLFNAGINQNAFPFSQFPSSAPFAHGAGFNTPPFQNPFINSIGVNGWNTFGGFGGFSNQNFPFGFNPFFNTMATYNAIPSGFNSPFVNQFSGFGGSPFVGQFPYTPMIPTGWGIPTVQQGMNVENVKGEQANGDANGRIGYAVPFGFNPFMYVAPQPVHPQAFQNGAPCAQAA